MGHIHVSMSKEQIKELEKFIKNSPIPTDRSKLVQKAVEEYMERNKGFNRGYNYGIENRGNFSNERT